MVETQQQIFTVTELTKAIKETLEIRFFSISVKGEITNFKLQSSGHAYFTLKDDHSQISAVIFKSVYQKLSQPLKVGDKVIVSGQVNVYIPRGGYQIIVQKLQYQGVGDLLLKFHELKNKLFKQGYFDETHKKPLPKFPKVIGVITSPTGSVIQDIIHVLSRRYQGFHLILNPVKVQGSGSQQEIAQAIIDFNTYQMADVLIIGRGGGSLEDLWSFNEICVAQAIYQSKIPIISAVGHETDFTIADLVADVRAPTPSAAAEIAIKEKSLQLEHLQKSFQMLNTLMRRIYSMSKLKLTSLLKQPLFAQSESALLPYSQKLDEKISRLDTCITHDLNIKRHTLESLKKRLLTYKPSLILSQLTEKKQHYRKSLDLYILRQVKLNQQKLDHLQQSISLKFFEYFKERKNKFNYLKNLLSSIDPKNVLKKGYCIPFNENKSSVILSSKDVKEEDILRLMFFDGQIKVKKIGEQKND